MLVKKIGTILIVKSKIYRLLYALSPLLMLLSVLLVCLVPQINQTYQFQQPALKTKVFTLQPSLSSRGNSDKNNFIMEQVFNGISINLIPGRISNQAIMLVGHCQDDNQKTKQIFSNVHFNLLNNMRKDKRHVTKNILFLCYNSSQNLQQYLNLYHNFDEDKYMPMPMLERYGIIRNALIFDINMVQKSSRNKRKPSAAKFYFNTYSVGSQLHTDVDYYQAVKQLLQQVGINKWEPCRAIDQSRIYAFVARYFSRYAWSLMVKNWLCQFNSIMTVNSPNKINQQLGQNNNYFQQKGIQAGTIQLFFSSESPDNLTQIVLKMSRLALSFVQQFTVLQDHLHSATTIYTPISQSKFTTLKGLILPGLAFIIITAIRLVIQLVYLMNEVSQKHQKLRQSDDQNGKAESKSKQHKFLVDSLKMDSSLIHSKILAALLIINISSVLFYFKVNILASFVLAPVFLFINKSEKMHNRQIQITKIILCGFCVLICLYCSIFCFPLSLLLIVITNVIYFFNSKARAILLVMCFIAISYIQQANPLNLLGHFWGCSVFCQICLYPLLMSIFLR